MCRYMKIYIFQYRNLSNAYNLLMISCLWTPNEIENKYRFFAKYKALDESV